jgi:hypothetical protein
VTVRIEAVERHDVEDIGQAGLALAASDTGIVLTNLAGL